MASHEGPTLRYRDQYGHVFSMKAADAKAAGYTLMEGEAAENEPTMTESPATEEKMVDGPTEDKSLNAPPRRK